MNILLNFLCLLCIIENLFGIMVEKEFKLVFFFGG